MHELPLNSDSNIQYALAVGMVVVIVIIPAYLSYKSYRGIKQKEPINTQGSFRGLFMRAAVGTGPNALAHLFLWSILTLAGVWALKVQIFNGGFIGLRYDEKCIQLDYRIKQNPINITWPEVRDIQLVERTKHNITMSWCVRILTVRGDKYESYWQPSKEKETVDLYKAAVSTLKQELKLRLSSPSAPLLSN